MRSKRSGSEKLTGNFRVARWQTTRVRRWQRLGGEFGYDALGRRVSHAVNGLTTQFVHDGDRIALETQGGAVTAVYRYGNSLIARNGEVVLADGLGTTRKQ